MTKETETNDEVATGDPGANQANGYYSYIPTADQIAEQRRQTSLHIAAGLRAPGHTRAAEVLADAKLFDAFLSGVDPVATADA